MPYKNADARRRASRESHRRRRARDKQKAGEAGEGVDMTELDGVTFTMDEGTGYRYLTLPDGSRGPRVRDDEPDRELQEEARAAVDELLEMGDQRWPSRQQFVDLNNRLNDLAARADQQRDSLRDTATEAIRAYMEAGPGSRVLHAARPEIEWSGAGDGQARATLRLFGQEGPALSRAYAWAGARQGVASSAPAGGIEPWFALASGNPWLNYAMLVNGAGASFRSPQFSGMALRKNGTVQDGLQAPDGISVAGAEAQTDVYDGESSLPRGPADWIPGARAEAFAYAMNVHSGQHGADVAAALKAAATVNGSTVPKVATGQTAMLPNAQDFPGKLAALLTAVAPQYRAMGLLDGCAWIISPAVESRILGLFSAEGSAFDPREGLDMLLGYPVHAVSHLDAGGTAKDVSAYFGAWQHALAIGLDSEFDMLESATTRPGALTYISHSRQGRIVRNPAAFAYLSTGGS